MLMMDPSLDGRDLVAYVLQSLEEEEEFHFLRFEFLQRLNITQLQVKLARLRKCIEKEYCVSSSNRELLEKTLRDYATAIRDYQFVRGQKVLGEQEIQDREHLLRRFFKSPEDLSDLSPPHYAFSQGTGSTIDPLRHAFMRYLPRQLSWSKEERRRREREYALGKQPKEVSKFVDQSVRFIIACIGSLFVIVPTLIEAAIAEPREVQLSQYNVFFTWTSFTLLFALTLSFAVKASNTETLVSTFTYATVLLALIAIFVQIGTGAGSMH
ncbi:uncharacterized protein GGS22DRAFT_199966 [Annulohypoxylon maeteangense]|uniref:uncharacterized protein n=1 Tax=Annulohypoxylon maeteangense TaxID=1927788 RepID=UPI002007C9B1|nr:uncharacterized protein GGS22DRAFT_199966 [Annulohypoxylon maeteangense]KAI0885794.1 hypothetical protein GGS22DRAFT_199966 [Annulohypoxylon maeteangense]